jgi:hypothetical protein
MSKRWKVNDGTQVDVGGKIRVGGDEFSATDDELDEFGSRPYVTEVRQQSAPKSDNKAQAAPKPHAAKSDDK